MTGADEPIGGYGNPAGREAEGAVVDAIYDAFARRDIDAALALMAPDVVLHLSGTAAAVGRAEPYRGHAGVREYFADLRRVWDSLELRLGHLRVTPGGVVAFGEVSGAEGGREVSRRVIWSWQIRDGLAASVRADDLGEASRGV